MLRYNFKLDNGAVEKDIIPVDKVNVLKMHSYEGRDSLLIRCHYTGTNAYKDGKLYVKNTVYLPNSDDDKQILNNDYEFNTRIDITSSNDIDNTFSFFIERYYKLNPVTVSLTHIDGVAYVYFYFNDSHYFVRNDMNGNEYDETKHPYIIYVTFTTESGSVVKIPFSCHYVNNTILRCEYDINDVVFKSLMDVIYDDNEFFENVTINDVESLYSILFSQSTKDEVGDISNIEIYRDNFLFHSYGLTSDERYYNVTTDFYCDKPLFNLSLPFSSQFQTDLEKDANIDEYFTDAEKKKAINSIVDMEKDVYHPCFIKNGKLTQLKSIKFNLHFRKHSHDSNWTTDNDSYWNGTYIANNKVNLMDNVGDNVTENGFFSYNNKSEQSDLLFYLGFTNNDVKFRKNKLKKSFLRLSFYDSMNASDQNLLAYYTIFYDTGKAFTKLMRHFEEDDYQYSMLNVTTGENTNKLNGLRVNREPYSVNGNVNDEDLRISSQFAVSDKYQSNNSSEGFYLYLWKDNDNGTIPTDIYLKVEFNHAGYGRSIPMMMPFVDPKKHNGNNGIKSFQDILDDFNGGGVDKPYGIRQYTKYSYIHLKYKYDKEKQCHVYYLDDNKYGNYGNEVKDNCLILNIYEAKISNKV